MKFVNGLAGSALRIASTLCDSATISREATRRYAGVMPRYASKGQKVAAALSNWERGCFRHDFQTRDDFERFIEKAL